MSTFKVSGRDFDKKARSFISQKFCLIFKAIKESHEMAKVSTYMIEIYNNNFYDLLAPKTVSVAQ